MARLIRFRDREPFVAGTAYLTDTATLIGDVRVEARAVVMFGAVLRADLDSIVLGVGSNLQDNAVIHTDRGLPALIGANVSIGHGAVVHGCTVEDDCLIGMNSTVLSGAVIGSGSLVAGGAVVLEGTRIPPRSLVVGVPGKVRRTIDDVELDRIRRNAQSYRDLAEVYRGQRP